MKKISLYFTIALAGLFVSSCSDDYTDWANPQGYAQEDAITIPGLTATAVEAQDLAIVGDSVATFTLSTAALPEGYSLQNARIELTPKGVDGATKKTVTTAINGKALAADMQRLIETVYGKRPQARTFDAQVYLNAVKGGQAVLIDAGKVAVVETPKAPFIDAAYYLASDATGWDAQSVKIFSHSDKDVYDDPVFSITFKTDKDKTYWKLITKTNFSGEFWATGTTGVVGVAVDGDNAKEGTLTTNNPQAAMIEGPGLYRLTINMMDYTYKVEALNFADYLYVAGDGNGWKHIDMLRSLANDGKYKGFMSLGSEFKFCSQADWNGTNYGLDMSTAGDAKNISVAKAGFYMVDCDLAALSYSLTEITTIGVIGDATANGWDADQDMTYDAATKSWVIKGITLKDGAIKLRANDGWGINWGGSISNPTFNSNDNIPVTAGTYDITFKAVCDGMNQLTMVKH